MHAYLGHWIYRDQNFLDLVKPALWGGLGVLLVGLVVAIPKDAARKRERKEGRRLKGPELVSVKEFNRRNRTDGIGFVQQERTLKQKLFGQVESLNLPRRAESSHILIMGDSGNRSAGAPSKTGCFVKGIVAGAATALVVGAVATVAAPVVGATAVTVGLGVLAVAGAASLGWTASHDISNRNWAGVAYDAGSVVGGFATGIAAGPRVATAIDPNATPGWSRQSWSAQAYDSSKGSFGDWMGTGPTHASAGVSTGTGGWLSSLFGAGCH